MLLVVWPQGRLLYYFPSDEEAASGEWVQGESNRAADSSDQHACAVQLTLARSHSGVAGTMTMAL